MTGDTYRPGDPARLENLPVELRAKDFALVARATVATAAAVMRDVPDDSLFLSVTLPDGGKVGRMVDCGDQGPRSKQDVETLLAQLPSVSAFLDAEGARQVRAAGPVLHGIRCAPVPGPAGPAFRGATLFRGTGLAAAEPLPLPGGAAPGLSLFRGVGAPAATVQLVPAAGTPVNLVLPHGATVTVTVSAKAGDSVGVGVSTGIVAGDDIIRLRAAGQVSDVAALVKELSPAQAALWLDTHPAAGAVLGYALLRTATPEAMGDAFLGAPNRWPNDPDAMIIAAEVAARLVRHEEAMNGFVLAIECGLPAYSFGLNYAADRLRTYGPRPNGPAVPRGMSGRIGRALRRVSAFASQQEAGILITCYPGADPTAPSVGAG